MPKRTRPFVIHTGTFSSGGRGTIQGQNMILAFKPPSQNIKGPHTQTLAHTQTHTSGLTSPSFIPLISFYLPLCKKLNKSRNPVLAPESLFFQEQVKNYLFTTQVFISFERKLLFSESLQNIFSEEVKCSAGSIIWFDKIDKNTPDTRKILHF